MARGVSPFSTDEQFKLWIHFDRASNCRCLFLIQIGKPHQVNSMNTDINLPDIKPQSLKHSIICSLMGVNICLQGNKCLLDIR